ncbi:MAG: hypothetical protein ABGX00_17105 [Allomuricauda sp.]|jgi:hypothetical protein|uniref:hypothetical protein n=1 Tax=Flagellimonas beolgyonensis TaxID=864064 RepID=UPI000F8D5056|nr:hypothetical protein [Allomuricauda beolgyonensis]
MKTVLVFKTSVEAPRDVRQLQPKLNQLVNGSGCWNFDLEDCDNILRVETQNLQAHSISELLENHGHSCIELH